MYNEKLDGNMHTEEEKQVCVMKRSGQRVPFDVTKIENAIRKSNADMGTPAERIPEEKILEIGEGIYKDALNANRDFSVEEIQDRVENALMASGKFSLARNYITYRYRHNEDRKMNPLDQKIKGIIDAANEEVKQENSNKNPTILSVQRDYIAGEWSRYFTDKYLLPDDIREAHKEGIIHFHDADYFAQHDTNCCLVNLEDMLQNGTCISGTRIDPPKSFATACTVTSQIVAQVASSQYGGQTISLAHLAPFVDVSRQKIRKRLGRELQAAGVRISESQFDELTEQEVRKEVESGCQTIQYQLITLQSTNGQAPFVTVFMYLKEAKEGQTRKDMALLIETMLRQRILGVKDRSGAYITPAFPKLIYVLDEDNAYPGSKYFDLTKLAAECTAKRMVPDYISAKKMQELKGDVYGCMGCRSFLTPDNEDQPEGLCNAGNKAKALNYREGGHKYYGRFNQGVVTINLVDVACSANGDMDKFWKIFDERLELCHRALLIRHERLLGTPSDVAPILWQDGALARLEPGEVIDPLLYGNYSTISLGYAGLYEMTVRMLGVSHTTKEGSAFAMQVMQYMNDKCAKWRAAENISYSLYGTPLESTTYKFAKCLQRRFGVIPDVTDHNYITNSYHINVREKISAFDKLTKEAAFQKLSPGGAISYVEVPNMTTNLQAVIAIMQHIYNTIVYAELNTKLDHCDVCGYEGEIRIVTDDTGKLVWECPRCKNRDQSKMHVARRTCGYIGSQYWNQGRTQEIRDRVLHVSLDAVKLDNLNPNGNK